MIQFLTDAITADTCQLSQAQRVRLADELQSWLVSSARKKQLPNLPEKIEGMKLRFQSFARSVKIVFTGEAKRSDDCGYEIMTGAADQETLRWLRYGAPWFEAHPNLIALILSV